jgi:uncharacterized protein (UPF0548 family)
VLRLRKPDAGFVEKFRRQQEATGFSYAQIGASDQELPPGFRHDRYRVRLGTGLDTFERGARAIDAWAMFDLGWIRMYANASLPGTTVVVVTRVLGLYSVDAGRVVYRFDEQGPTRRYGFGYGTLLAHAEAGEERFTIEWDPRSDEVWYDVVSFSRPRAILPRLAFPLTRSLQRRFVRDSQETMLSVVRDPASASVAPAKVGRRPPPPGRTGAGASRTNHTPRRG